MPITVPGNAYPYTADVDLPPYLIAKFGSVDGNCALAAGATDKFLGVTERVAVAAGYTASICTGGQPPIVFGATANPGDYLTSDASGRAIPIASGATANSIGRALETCAAVGEVHPIEVRIGRVTVP